MYHFVYMTRHEKAYQSQKIKKITKDKMLMFVKTSYQKFVYNIVEVFYCMNKVLQTILKKKKKKTR